MDEEKTVEVLWTGGYDSTFMMALLSQKPIRIQPVYLQCQRRSEPQERGAMKKIRELLLKHPSTKAQIAEPKIIPWGSVTEDPAIAAGWDRINKEFFLGGQYKQIASYAKDHPGMCIGLQNHHAVSILRKTGKLDAHEDEAGWTYYTLDPAASPEHISVVFSYYRLPIADYTKADMKKWFQEGDYGDIAALTWTCHLPIHGKPCGLCNPCAYAIEEGMPERIGRAGLRRYRFRKRKEEQGTWKKYEWKRYVWMWRLDRNKERLRRLFGRGKKDPSDNIGN